jgi:hypothetical protein
MAMKRGIIMLTSVKGRQLLIGQKVKVYFNLHKQCFSIKDIKTGLVVAHASELTLRDCSFKVSESGRQRVLREKRKNVHAYVVGTFVWDMAQTNLDNHALYNPYKYSSFVNENGQPLHAAEVVSLRKKAIKYA